MSATNALAASVKQRLFNYAVRQRADFNQVQVRYVTERLLYRLSVSPHASSFLLKGAMLFVIWEDDPHRPTRDIDLLSIVAHDRASLVKIFREIAGLGGGGDGLEFDATSVTAEEIREDNAYGGIRVKLLAHLGNARIPVQVDVGMGDSVHPEPQWVEFPTILEFPAPRVCAYPAATVVAEKFHVIVELQDRNTRMKDYYDIHYLLRRFEFSGEELAEALRRTFQRRRTTLPGGTPPGLQELFWANETKMKQWQAFLGKNRLPAGIDLRRVCEEIAVFLEPVLNPVRSRPGVWRPGGGWN
jgi:hypothetical protein